MRGAELQPAGPGARRPEPGVAYRHPTATRTRMARGRAGAGRSVAALGGAALVYDAALDEDPELIEAVAAAAAIALEHERSTPRGSG